ncbi:MAG TPA: Fic family protein [Allosphingosinicella sp.]|nr:Fic family protein [Allosphingosinicella sp.]
MTLKPTYAIPCLPPNAELETPSVLRAAARAHRRLAELKGRAGGIPNPAILIDTLSLQEAKASSEIENIVTTQDELFQISLFPENPASPAAKEVALYRDALRVGHDALCARQGLLTNNTIVRMFQVLKRTTGGYRATPGTALKNEASGKLVYIPPQDAEAIRNLMGKLERFINEDAPGGLDPLIKMAVIHHQFESIHPFPDGNGRIGRIVNVLYLVREKLLDIPILYLSRYITANKGEYYRLLQAVRETGDWESWIVYMLEAVASTSIDTLRLIGDIEALMRDYKNELRTNHRKIYSQDLLNTLFRFPYTRIEFLQRELGISRQTAARYLDRLTAGGLLSKHRAGRSNYYVNDPLVALFIENVPAPPWPVPEAVVSTDN